MTRHSSASRNLAVVVGMSALVTTCLCIALTQPVSDQDFDGSRAATHAVPIIEYDMSQAPHVGNLRSAEFTPDSRFLITKSDVGGVILWDARNGLKIRDILESEQPNRFANNTSVAQRVYYGLVDDTRMLMAYRSSDVGDNSVWLELVQLPEAIAPKHPDAPLRFKAGKPKYRHPPAFPQFAALSRDGQYLIGEGQGSLQVWNVATQERIWDAASKSPISEDEAMAISRKYQQAKWHLGNSSGAIERMMIYASIRPDGQRLHWPGSMYVQGEGTTNTFGPLGNRYVTTDWSDTGSSDEEVILWDVATREPLKKTWRPYADPQHMHFTTDGRVYLERGDKPNEMNLRDASSAELVHQFVHATDITARAISPDDTTCLSATTDGHVHLWDLQTGERTMDAFVGRVHVASIAYRHDAKQCLIGTRDGIAVSLELPTGKTAVRFENDNSPEPTTGVARYSPDGSRVVIMSAANECGQASLWDAETGDRLRLLAGPVTHEVWLSPNGQWALCVPWKSSPTMAGNRSMRTCEEAMNQGSQPNEILLRNAASGDVLHVFRKDTQYVRLEKRRSDFQLTWQRNRFRVDSVVKPADLKTSANLPDGTGRMEFSFMRPQRDVIANIQGLDDAGREWLLSMVENEPRPNDGEPQIRWAYKLKDGSFGQTLAGIGGSAKVLVAVKPDADVSKRIIPSKDVLAEYRDDELPTSADTEDYKRSWSATAAAMTVDRSKLLVAYSKTQTTSSRTLVLWDVKTNKRLRTFDLSHVTRSSGWHVESLLISPDNQYAAVGFDYHAYVFNLETGEGFDGADLRGYSLQSGQEFARFSSDSKRVVFLDKKRSLWDIERAKQIGELEADDILIGPVFSPNGKFVASISGRNCHVWNATTGAKLGLENRGYHGGLFEASADGTRFVAPRISDEKEGFDVRLTLWDFQSGKQLAALYDKNEKPDIRDAIFTPDGKRLVTTYKNKLSVWDAESGQLLGSANTESEFDFKGNRQRPLFIDSNRFVTSHQNGAILWNLETVKPIHSFPVGQNSRFFVRLFDGDQKLLGVSPGHDGSVWDLSSGKQLATLSTIPGDLMYGVDRVQVSADAQQVFAVHRMGEAITAWDASSGRKTRRHLLLDRGRQWLTEPKE